MKKLAIFSSLVATLLVGLIAGGWLGAWYESRICLRLSTSKPDVDAAVMAAKEALWLADLRLNETTNAISDLEHWLDMQVGTLAAWNEIAPPDENTRQARDRWLRTVKIYRQSYPATGNEAASINALLSTIPGRDPKSTCQNGVCRLDDLRLGKLSTITNSP